MTATRVAIVTGAGSGIGQAVALQLAQAGYELALVGRTASKLHATADQIATHRLDQRVAVFPVDLTSDQATIDLVHRVVDQFNRIDAIANVAGVAELTEIAQITPQLWRRIIDGNLSYIVHLTAAAWPTLIRSGGGTIVNVSSMSSIDPFQGFSIYAAAKAGVNMFTHCTAQEGQAVNIRAVCIAPGCVETPMLRQLFDKSVVPAEAAMAPAAVAQIICDCITGARAFQSGETIPLPTP